MSIPATNSIIVTGASGQVGGALARLLPEAQAPGRAQLDLTSEGSIRRFIRETKPRWIINPAAYTAVDKAESESELAYAINADAPRILGEEAARLGAAVLHFSTDYVFDGEKETPYEESDPTGPLGVYGASKLAGERGLAATGAAHLILRTSWVYGASGKNFLLTILKLAKQRAELRIVADQHGAPTWSYDLAVLAAQIISRYGAEEMAPLSGVYHATGQGETTWHGFASEAVRQAGHLEPGTEFARLIPIPSEEYPTPARRPRNSRLNCDKLQRTIGIGLPMWQASLTRVLALLGSDKHE